MNYIMDFENYSLNESLFTEKGKKYKNFILKADRDNSEYEINEFGKGINAQKALDFIKKVIDALGNRKIGFDTFALFYSGYQGFVIYDGNIEKGYIMYDGPWNAIEDWGSR